MQKYFNYPIFIIFFFWLGRISFFCTKSLSSPSKNKKYIFIYCASKKNYIYYYKTIATFNYGL